VPQCIPPLNECYGMKLLSSIYVSYYVTVAETLFDVAEFIPYVFQVLALMLEMHADNAVSPPYLALFPHLLQPILWSRDGNIPPLVRLLEAYISRGVRQIDTDKLVSLYYYLIASHC